MGSPRARNDGLGFAEETRAAQEVVEPRPTPASPRFEENGGGARVIRRRDAFVDEIVQRSEKRGWVRPAFEQTLLPLRPGAGLPVVGNVARQDEREGPVAHRAAPRLSGGVAVAAFATEVRAWGMMGPVGGS